MVGFCPSIAKFFRSEKFVGVPGLRENLLGPFAELVYDSALSFWMTQRRHCWPAPPPHQQKWLKLAPIGAAALAALSLAVRAAITLSNKQEDDKMTERARQATWRARKALSFCPCDIFI